MYCVGAAKAGTSWLYRYLHDHPECHLRSIKELHYFDTFNDGARDKQLEVFRRQRARYGRTMEEAAAEGRRWQKRNMARRCADLDALIPVIEGSRQDDLAYGAYLLDGLGEARLVADMTPAYSLEGPQRIARMAALSPMTRFVYLIRDPVARMWSHVRMQAQRFLQKGEVVERKARNILNRTVNKGKEGHIPLRGDYAATVARLEAAVPEGRLLVEFTERLFTGPGLERICAFLGISHVAADTSERVLKGPEIALDPKLRADAQRFLAPQYAWAEARFGTLPEAWQANMARV